MTERRVIFPPPGYFTQPKENNTMSEIYNINPSDQTIIIAATEVHTAYGKTNDGAEYIGLYVKDARVGELFMPISIATAGQLIGNIAGILGNIDDMRGGWDNANRGR